MANEQEIKDLEAKLAAAKAELEEKKAEAAKLAREAEQAEKANALNKKAGVIAKQIADFLGPDYKVELNERADYFTERYIDIFKDGRKVSVKWQPQASRNYYLSSNNSWKEHISSSWGSKFATNFKIYRNASGVFSVKCIKRYVDAEIAGNIAWDEKLARQDKNREIVRSLEERSKGIYCAYVSYSDDEKNPVKIKLSTEQTMPLEKAERILDLLREVQKIIYEK